MSITSAPSRRTWPHLASSTASSSISTADCLTTLLPVLLAHSHVQISLPLGDEKGGPVGISKSPLSTSRHQRAPPPSQPIQIEHVQLTQRVQCQSLDHCFSLPYSLLESVNGAPFLAGRQSSPSQLAVPACVPCSTCSVIRLLCRQTSSCRTSWPL